MNIHCAIGTLTHAKQVKNIYPSLSLSSGYIIWPSPSQINNSKNQNLSSLPIFLHGIKYYRNILKRFIGMKKKSTKINADNIRIFPITNWLSKLI